MRQLGAFLLPLLILWGCTLTESGPGFGVPKKFGSYDVPPGSVTQSQLAPRPKSSASPAPAGSVAQSAVVNSTGTNSSPADVTGLTVTLSTTGRPVWVGVMGCNLTAASYLSVAATGGAGTAAFAIFNILRNGTTVATNWLLAGGSSASSTQTEIPPAMFFIDFVSAGNYTYKIQASASTVGYSGSEWLIQNTCLVAYEL